jgi:hypothetical protein
MDSLTLSEAIIQLRNEGYSIDFNLKKDCFQCQNGNIRLHPEDFVIDKYIRFEGISDPADQCILYAISARRFKAKGLFVSGYGIYTEDVDYDLLVKLQNN